MTKVNITLSDGINDKIMHIQRNNNIRTKDEVIELIIRLVDENIKLKNGS